MTGENNISAERASEIADTSKKDALEQEFPKVLAKIMAMIKEAAQCGNKSIMPSFDDVHDTNEVPPSLREGDLFERISDHLSSEYGYVVSIERDTRSITIRWDEINS